MPRRAGAGMLGTSCGARRANLGFLCVDIPEKWGGAGGDFRHEAVLHEEMARRALSGMSIGVHSIAAHYLLNHGTDDQKRRYLPRLAKGELVGAIAMTEPGAGSDLQAIRTRAERHGNQYAINGSKTFISNGFLAGLVVVVCKTDPAERARGISLLLVKIAPASGSGACSIRSAARPRTPQSCSSRICPSQPRTSSAASRDRAFIS